MNNGRRPLVHPAPWNQKELHLGPADNCHACGTDSGDPADVADGFSVGLVVSLIIWAAAALLVSWWWWS